MPVGEVLFSADFGGPATLGPTFGTELVAAGIPNDIAWNPQNGQIRLEQGYPTPDRDTLTLTVIPNHDETATPPLQNEHQQSLTIMQDVVDQAGNGNKLIDSVDAQSVLDFLASF